MANTKSKAKAKEPVEEMTRLQRMLMYTGGSVLGFGIAAIVALLIGEYAAPKAVVSNIGVWGVVAFIPDIALPLGFLVLIVLLVITFRRRALADKGAGK